MYSMSLLAESLNVALIYMLFIGQAKLAPTLGCSIEILRDICQYVCLWETHTKICMPKCVGRITWSKHEHAQSQFWEFETVPLGNPYSTFIRPVKTDV